MSHPIDVTLFFNFRSPYCYLASKTLWPVVDDYNVNLIWKPVGGWDLRSSPDRVQKKLPIARQDLARFARRLQIPVTPPPKTTDPTLAGAVSLLAGEKGLLREYIISVMDREWATGADIGQPDVLLAAATDAGLDASDVEEAMQNPLYLQQLEQNARDADEGGVIGVPTFVIGDQIFWGQDRIDFVLEELAMLSEQGAAD